MFAEEFPTVLDSLTGEPSPEVEKRASEEEDVTLTSGRTPLELLELVSELVDTLREVWDNGSLSRLPANLQRGLQNHSSKTADALQNYASGQIPAQNLENQVDQLHTLLWQNNLIDRPPELAGLDRKHKSLESLKRKGRRIVKELEQGLKKKADVEKAAGETETLQEGIESNVKAAAEKLQEINQTASQATQQLRELKTNTEEAQRLANQTDAASKRANESANEVDAVTKKIQQFHSEIDTKQETLSNVVSTAESTVTANKTRTDKLIEELERLEREIKEQLQKATGASLFHSFNERRSTVGRAKWSWAVLSITSLGVAVWWGVFLAQSAADPDAMFFAKLGGTVPLVAVIVFCLAQYGRERKAEEEYAFKSALSLSLVPFKELVEDLEETDHTAEYAKFLVKTIDQIYQAPRIVSEDPEKDRRWVYLGTLERIVRAIERVVDRGR